MRRSHSGRARAYEMGLLNAVVPREQLLDTAREFAQRIVANAPLAVQATKQSAFQGLYFDEDVTRARCAARCAELRRALVADGADPAAIAVEILDASAQGAAHAVREGESQLSSAIFQTEDAKEGPKAFAEKRPPVWQARSERDRSAHAVHHRCRRAHVASRRRRRSRARPNRSTMWEQVARAAAADAGSTATSLTDARQHQDRLLPDLAVRRRRRAASPIGSAPTRSSATTPGIGGTTAQQLVERHRRAHARAASSTSRSITSAEALATQRAYKKRGERCAVLVQARRKRPFPWESPPDPVEVAHEVFQAWLTFAVFDNARRAHLGIDLDDVPRRHRRDDARR